ncbi:ChrR family anti-sigma-E factor [Maricaulis sp.]|uniref:ChrR family anti-sigma-E factor n=1 Tax=Maricaulis sp. TaxID=1486257 RepID=UPI003A9204AF
MSQRGYALDDGWYLDHAAGAAMTPGQDVLLQAHLEISPAAREQAGAITRIGGAMLESIDDADEASLAFDIDDIFARDAGETPAPDVTAAEADSKALPDYLPDAVRTFMAESHVRLRWEFLGPGLEKAMLWRGGDDERLWLLRARPGVAIPHHGHRGSELTLVLKGSFYDGDQRYQRGDVEEADPGVEHDIRIGDEGECICLALTEGKLRFQDPLLRLFQVFTGL